MSSPGGDDPASQVRSPTYGGRVTLRDVLDAVERSETRLGHRFDRVDRRLDEQDKRIESLERSHTATDARRALVREVVSGSRAAVALAIAAISALVGVLAAVLAMHA